MPLKSVLLCFAMLDNRSDSEVVLLDADFDENGICGT